ncbi:hypothetical protein BCR41DRAFT_344331 [Lobosporangium transversale]|uniref:Mid2 domain-containing protein n=1 Tax=Lobosporangium transversale TaxID=64571 RepID=A0A1Y2H324_9FUNG|nr:hypothetical protein BCR41DRAFT_344331 [Lobosporangium transversale]ORZ28948.1 hypothetical protein BCR41DRAFT_344331 [Lobosporangium transversale]|eukprot:XP_021886621.1 hypothetical protein BCR41DRAFT_344331 [Lobosporangium transversale]
MPVPFLARHRCQQQQQQSQKRFHLVQVSIFALLLVLAVAPRCTAASDEAHSAYIYRHPGQTIKLYQRQVIPPVIGTNSPSSSDPPTTSSTTVDVPSPTTPLTPSTPTSASTTTSSVPVRPNTSLHNSNSRTATQTLTSSTGVNTAPTSSPSKTAEAASNHLVVAGAAVGGLVFAIGVGIIAFRCTMNRRERQRRNKEMAATLAENFDRGGDPIGTPRKGYLELSDGPSTPVPGRAGANLSRQGSQDAYYAHKESGGGQQDYYNPHYVQERYGTAPTGNYGMYEETELSVMGNSHSMAYPSTSAPSNHYGGYNDYGSHHDAGGYYGGAGSQPPRGPQAY